MVQTRRAAQLAPKDEPINQKEHTRRPSKRARKEDRPALPVSEQNSADTALAKRPRKPRQRKQNEVPTPSEFPPRVSSAWKVGAHVSAAGGVENAILNAARVGANAFALFVKSQRKWASPPLTDDSVASFKARMTAFGYDPAYVLPHGSYLVNLANPDAAKRETAYACFVDDVARCERLGLTLYNFHPGSTVGNGTKDASIAFIAQCLNRAHRATSSVITVIENMSGAKNVIGSQFTELRDIIEQVEDKTRVGVCLDTCHLYAAGYDIATKDGWDATLATFDEQVGLSYLRGMHLNDSKTPLGSKKDRHENIGLGTLKLVAFHTILSDPRVQHIPLILETPMFEADAIWGCEIKVLNMLSEMAVGSGEDEDTSREEELDAMVADIRNVIREHRGHEKAGEKASRGSTTKSKAKPRKRKMADVEEEEATESDDAESCSER